MVVVDTDILIAAIRNNEIDKSILRKYSGSNISISLITEMELFIGATNTSKKWAVEKIIESRKPPDTPIK